MENKTGIIKTIITKPCKNGTLMYSFEMEDGFKYNTFDSKIGTAFKPGDNVEMQGEMNGKFWNMKSMVLICGKTEKVAQEAPKQAPALNSSRESSIIAQTLTKCFAEVMASNPGLNVENIKQHVLEAYNFFKKSV
jgi:hypothetical protein